METPVPEAPPPLEMAPPNLDWRRWLRRVLHCNPFYLVSAALLLFGISRLSVDPRFLGTEVGRLLFNFSALQVYEALLVWVAIVLARRTIWYDSTLLAVLENGFVLVPFIFLTQAVLIGQGLTLALCLCGAGLAVTRLAVLKKSIKELNMPPILLGFGGLLLGLNLALPLYFRSVIEHGTDQWLRPSRLGWLVFLPLLQALANVLPRPRHRGALEPERSWLPQLVFSLWIAASAVHLYCVGYVANLRFAPVQFVPMLWVQAWTVWNRLADFRDVAEARWQAALLLPPAVIPFLAGARFEISLPLVLMNIGFFGGLSVRKRHLPLALVLMQASIVTLLAGLPEGWGHWLMRDFTRGKALVYGIAGNLLIYSLFSRLPLAGLAGAVMAAGVPAVMLTPVDAAVCVQTGLVFLLAHSLRWGEGTHSEAVVMRWLTALAWVAHSFVLTYDGEWLAVLVVLGGATCLLALTALTRWLKGAWSILVGGSALLVAASPALNHLAILAQNSPAGLASILGSFLLFGLGTALALSKHRWSQK